MPALRKLGAPKRLVVKLGSAVLSDGQGLRARRLSRLGRELAAEWRQGRKILLVSSGAIAVGLEGLGLSRRPRDLVGLQAAASVGQVTLMAHWTRAFARQGLRVAQVLLTHEDIADRRRYLNARHTLLRLWKRGVLPIVNENDSVSTEEIRLGDNDHLAALCTGLVGAQLLLLLTDVEGVYDSDPNRPPAAGASRAKVLSTLNAGQITSLLRSQKGNAHSGSGLGSGGIHSKLLAASQGSELGAHSIIASGARTGLVRRLLAGEPLGSWVPAQAAGLRGRKSWLAHASRARGVLVVDEGARQALCERGKSLLPSGVRAVEGSFKEGAVVSIQDLGGKRIALGLCLYSAAAVRRIAGAKSSEIESLLGYRVLDEVVHRDDLVILREAPQVAH